MCPLAKAKVEERRREDKKHNPGSGGNSPKHKGSGLGAQWPNRFKAEPPQEQEGKKETPKSPEESPPPKQPDKDPQQAKEVVPVGDN